MKPYMPSNGTEGEIFKDEYCYQCYKERQCTILLGAFTGKQPKQWVVGDDGIPVCTSFKSERPKNKPKTKRELPGQKTLF